MRNTSPIASPRSYNGENTVVIAPSLAGASAREVRVRLGEWCDFLSEGPSEILDLAVLGRTPQRLFDALSSQTQLRRLEIGWGPFDHLDRLEGLSALEDLNLSSATSASSLEPLREHPQLISLELGNLKRVRDYAPLANLVNLRQLSLHSEVRAVSIDFVSHLRNLHYLSWSLIPEDLDLSPLLALTWVEEMSVRTRRDTTPSSVELEWTLPGIQRWHADRKRGVVYAWRGGERIGDYRERPDGQRGLYRYDIEDFEPWRAGPAPE